MSDNEEHEFCDDQSTKNEDASAKQQQQQPTTSSSTKSSSADSSVVFSPELLGMYYSRLFPYQVLYAWP